MKKTIVVSLFLSLLLFSLPIISMDLVPGKYKLVSFETDDGIVAIEKKNIPLIGVLYERYNHYLNDPDKPKNNEIELLQGTAKQEEIIIVNNALNARPDTFKDYFTALTKAERDTLVRVSMSFKQNGRTVGLCVPEMTRRLLRVFLPTDITAKIERFSNAEKEKRIIVDFCLSQSIKKQGFLNSSKVDYFSRKKLASTLSWDSSFFSGPFSHNEPLRAKPLPIEKSLYKTYGSVFFSDQYEIRIIDGAELQSRDFAHQPLGNACVLHVMNHKTQESIAQQDILHANNIKGYCSAKADGNTHYFVTYSDKDIVFVTLTKNGSNEFIIDQTQIQIPGAMMVTAGFKESLLHIVVYKGYQSVLCSLDHNNNFREITRFRFKEWGMTDQIFAVDKGFVMLCPLAAKAYAYLVDNNLDARRLRAVSEKYYYYPSYCMCFLHTEYPNRGLLAWRVTDTVFKSLQSYRKKQEEEDDLLQRAKNYFSVFNPDNECHRVYSPDGRFMMTNMLTTKMRKLYIKTSITDVMNQQEIMSHDVEYGSGKGVGFSCDSRNLLLFDGLKSSSIISLITDEFEECMEQFEKFALQDLGTMALISRLIPEILEKDYIEFQQSDTTRQMLISWANSKGQQNIFKDFMQKCFPFGAIV